MTLAHTLDESPLREDLAHLLAEAPPPPRSAALRAETSQVAGELARVWTGAPLPAGAQVGPYTIEAVLGQGGQGTVYRALDPEGRAWALKVPRPELVSRLVREAQILFHLDHPRVVRIEKAAFKDEPIPYVVTEFLPDGSLADLLEREPGGLAPGRVARLADEVLEALAYAHEKGVVHRDLKPSNILFDKQGQAKVADFGIGSLALIEGRRVDGTLVSADRTVFAGTPIYMAPEQEHIAEPLDGRADQYALGKLLYQALTGRSPRTVRPLGLGPGWDAFLFQLLEDRPEDRFPSAEAAREALAALRAGSTAGSGAGPAPAVAIREDWSPREPALSRAGGASVDLVVAAVELLRAEGRTGLVAFPGQESAWRRWRAGPEPRDAHALSGLAPTALARWAAGGGVVLRRDREAIVLAAPSGPPVLSPASHAALLALFGQRLSELGAEELLLLGRDGRPWLRVGELPDTARIADLAAAAGRAASELVGGSLVRAVQWGEQGAVLLARVDADALLAAWFDAREVDEHLAVRAFTPLAAEVRAVLAVSTGRVTADPTDLQTRALALCATDGVAVFVSIGGEVLLGERGRLRVSPPASLRVELDRALGVTRADPARAIAEAPAEGPSQLVAHSASPSLGAAMFEPLLAAIDRVRSRRELGLFALPGREWAAWKAGAVLRNVHPLPLAPSLLASLAVEGGVVLRHDRTAISLCLPASLPVPRGAPSAEVLAALRPLLERARPLVGAHSLLLLDREGRPWLHEGDTRGVNAETEAALVAAGWAAQREVGQMLGERGWAQLGLRGEGQGLLVVPVGERALVAARFTGSDLHEASALVGLPPLAAALACVLEAGPGEAPASERSPGATTEAQLQQRARDLCAEDGLCVVAAADGLFLGQEGQLRRVSRRALARTLRVTLGVVAPAPDAVAPPRSRIPALLGGLLGGLALGLLLAALPRPSLASGLAGAVLFACLGAGWWAGTRAARRTGWATRSSWLHGPVGWALLLLVATLGATGLPLGLDTLLHALRADLGANPWPLVVTGLAPLLGVLVFCLTLAARRAQLALRR